MKRFLKPTGRILTTAVFTSTALETLVPATATPSPVTDDLPSDTSAQAVSRDTPPPKTKTIIPPEALANQEFAQKYPPLPTFKLDVDSPSEPSLPLLLDPMDDLAETSPSVPPVNFVFHDIPDLEHGLEPSSSPIASSQSSVSSSDVAHAPSQDIDPPNHQAIAPTHAAQQDAEPHDTDDSEQEEVTPDEQPDAQEDGSAERLPHPHSSTVDDSASTLANSASSRQASPLEDHQMNEFRSSDNQSSANQSSANQSSDNNDVVSATREWLDETLARIVNRDRLNRERQFRNTLIQTARDYLAQGDVQQAKQIAENPALTEAEREELFVAIAEVESNATYPFVSADHALALSTRSIRDQPRPSREWLLAQMDAAVESLDPTCYDMDNPALSAFAPAGTSIPGVFNGVQEQGRSTPVEGGSGQDVFRSGGEFLSGVGHQPPSMTARRSLPPRTTKTAQNQHVARQENCTPTFGQNIGGLTFATLSGYQWLTQFSRPANVLRMVFPLAIPAVITSHFGWRIHPIYGNRRFHFGIDFGAPSGTPVLAAMPGRVETSNYLDGYGLTVILENQDLEQRTLYAHMSGIAVRPGTWIEQGDIIGWVGSTGNSTGPHLHFEVHQRQGSDWVAVDPLQAAAQLIANRPDVPVP